MRDSHLIKKPSHFLLLFEASVENTSFNHRLFCLYKPFLSTYLYLETTWRNGWYSGNLSTVRGLPDLLRGSQFGGSVCVWTSCLHGLPNRRHQLCCLRAFLPILLPSASRAEVYSGRFSSVRCADDRFYPRAFPGRAVPLHHAREHILGV